MLILEAEFVLVASLIFSFYRLTPLTFFFWSAECNVRCLGTGWLGFLRGLFDLWLHLMSDATTYLYTTHLNTQVTAGKSNGGRMMSSVGVWMEKDAARLFFGLDQWWGFLLFVSFSGCARRRRSWDVM